MDIENLTRLIDSLMEKYTSLNEDTEKTMSVMPEILSNLSRLNKEMEAKDKQIEALRAEIALIKESLSSDSRH